MSDEKQKNKVWFVEYYRIERSLEYVRQYNPESSWQKLSIALERKRKTRRIVYFSSAAAVVALFVVSAYSGITNGLLENKKTGAPGVYGYFAKDDPAWCEALD